ncbi:ABC transporter substrate-binding protein [Bradyrhizobium diazoefficiens]|nr:ABC transporter substrate-binding protein [Bradyrhizobium diazoefficiens]UCF51261.1 MAG: ABC transporter substrate-binding protein [Bradyrhizobium sp.]MBR0965424.1 ABC transporter substrate-binding protein [Bradyrhizobium diazoefficiens]MBR0979969.1 ABC transporter substrate-binding protein [Bradyrhizobium diazoefficiens]MBR1009317.1 ABC transporter substrate-binding protein [Bradyrhizobium diazoefficiens]MBR1015622.1 ABC transporter substrate-binding protein [Bradyrhizobium diazoefficiens]
MSKTSSHRGRINRRTVLAGTASLIAAPWISSTARAQAKQVNIGVIMPLSGANAQFGTNSRNGIELVADEINAAGGIKALGNAKINLIVADATSTPTTAGTVAQRMISQNEVTAILGAFASSLTIAISEVTERRDIPLLTMSFADQITGRGYKNIFQVVAKASALGKAQLDYTVAIAQAAGTRIDKIAIMYEDTAYGTAQAGGLRAAAKAANIELVMDDAYPLGITDTTPLINKLRASGAQAVFPVSYLNDSLLLIRTMRQQRITIPAIGGAAGYVIPDFEKGLGEFAEGVLSIAPANYDLDTGLTDRFRKRFGYFMVHEALEHAVALDVLVQAIEKAKSAKAEDVTMALRGAKFTGGWTNAMTGGAVEFDSSGLNTASIPVMVQWRKKELVTVWPKDVAKGAAEWKS